MDYRKLKHTDLNVSRLCFGTMTFGKPADQPTATRMVEHCIDEGINFIDTANIYQAGIAESMLGEAIRGKRDKLILATKVRGKMGEGPDESGLSKPAILRAIDDSLNRLKTDYIDLYYLHQPDCAVPIEETLGAMEELVSKGKVRYPGTSNYAAWQICEMLWVAEKHGYAPAYVSQRHPENFAAVEKLKQAAQQVGRSLISVALNWMLCHTPTDCVILGASRVEQLEQNLAACNEGPLPREVLQICDQVWADLRNPVPIYNR